ncbi:hypothetical protein QIS74_12677 [Colletotrichum tabaci]|uniref:Uncharacterized protein n=1 Tax=Colletotrichum tabaci TaxID=1209068 RepID=A0AAV9SUU1_9PEZI
MPKSPRGVCSHQERPTCVAIVTTRYQSGAQVKDVLFFGLNKPVAVIDNLDQYFISFLASNPTTNEVFRAMEWTRLNRPRGELHIDQDYPLRKLQRETAAQQACASNPQDCSAQFLTTNKYTGFNTDSDTDADDDVNADATHELDTIPVAFSAIIAKLRRAFDVSLDGF